MFVNELTLYFACLFDPNFLFVASLLCSLEIILRIVSEITQCYVCLFDLFPWLYGNLLFLWFQVCLRYFMHVYSTQISTIVMSFTLFQIHFDDYKLLILCSASLFHIYFQDCKVLIMLCMFIQHYILWF